MKNKTNITARLKQRATELGFDHCGIAPAGFMEKEANILEKWLSAGMHGTMSYMEHHFEKRVDPRKLLPGAKSVIVFLKNYFPEETLPEEDNYVLSKYAYGTDYHFVIKDKLKTLIGELKEEAGEIAARAFTDSAPVLERAWAERAGLGWIGKNANFIVPKKGSFFFISEIITDLELDYDPPKKNDLCGACRNCIDACPTKAIVAPGVIDARRCISYLTIELRDKIPEDFKGKFKDRVFGCDICQDVCPWTRFQKSHREPAFQPKQKLREMKKPDWEEMEREEFNALFRKSAVKRTKFEGLKRNVRFLGEGA